MTRFVLFVFFVLPLSGCVQPGQVKLGGCPVVKVPEECQQPAIATEPKLEVVIRDNPGGRKDAAGGEVVAVTPLNLCVLAGTTIEVEIQDAATVFPVTAIIPKKFTDTWLIASNIADKTRIEIQVPADAGDLSMDDDEDGWVEYDYSFVTSNGGCLDPRFHVRN